MALYNNDSVYNSDHFDLTKWYLGLPIDSSGGTTGVSASIYNLTGFEDAYFYDAPDGGMVFNAPVTGATTSGSHGARSELRELAADGSLAKWTVAQGGTMTATLQIDNLPYYTSTGAPAKMIIGQIHGSSNELCRLYDDNGHIYFKDDVSGSTDSEHTYQLTDAAGKTATVGLGEKFSYEIDAHGSTLTVKAFIGGDTYTGSTTINSYWNSDTLYFKAGAYLGVSKDGVSIQQGYGYGQDTFYALDYSHTAGQGLNGLAPGSISGTSGNDYLNANPTTGSTINGGAGNDHLTGHDANDTLIGGTGNDTVSGYGGHDVFIENKGDQGLYIMDFSPADPSSGDKVVLEGYTSTDIAGATLTEAGSDAVLTFTNGDTVTFHNTATSSLTNGNLLADVGGTLQGFFSGIAPSPTPVPSPTPAPAPSPSPSPTPTGTDPYNTAPSETLTVNGTSGNDTLNANSKTGTAVYGLAGNDVISGHDGNDALYGGDGTDVVHGYWGNDWINGGTGNDTLTGDNGNDTLIGGTGNDSVSGGTGHDVFVENSGDQGMYITDFTPSDVNNGDQMVLVGYSAADLAAATLTQSGSDSILKFANGDAVTFHNVSTSALTDSNLLADVGGTLEGYFTAHSGGTTITPTPSPAPSPSPSPTPSTDPYLVEPSETLTVNGTSGNDTLNANSKTGTLVNGMDGNDSISGHDGNDALLGGNGNDILHGYWGNDWIDGGAGTDTLTGDNGNDTLLGGAGVDTLTGGAGADVFVFRAGDVGTGVDKITDYSASQGDKIDISDVLHGHYDPATQAITDFVQITTSGSNSILSVDLDGTGTAYGWQQVATISGVTGLTDEQALVTAGHLIVS